MATYVLVHGGGHGGWCYAKLARLLRAAGHEVYTPTLTGLGERKHLLNPDIDLDTQITDVVNLLFYEDLTDVILAGHSYGGMVITGVADRAPDRIAHLVFLDAALPKDGEALAEIAYNLMSEAYKQARIVDGTELALFPDSDSVRHYGVTDPADEAWMRPKLTPHPWKCFSQKLRLQDEARMRAIPRTFVGCTPMLALRPPEYAHRIHEVDHYFELDTGHDLMITQPEKTADILLSLA